MAAGLFLLLWQGLVQMHLVPVYLLPSPQQVVQAVIDSPDEFTAATFLTFKSTLIGFVLSGILGFSFALILSFFEILKRAFLPFSVFFQTVPIIAIAPLLVIWFGFGEPTVRISAMIVSFFPMLANSLVGLSQVDPGLEELFKAYKATPMQKLLKLQIPGSLPFVMTGLKISAGLSVIGGLVGEFVAGGGLGGLIDAARTQQRVDLVFAAVILSSLLGVFFILMIQLLSHCLLIWRPFYRKELI